MLAACTGLAYHLSSAFRLEAYLGAFFPLPAVLSAARWSGAAAVKTTARWLHIRLAFAALTALRRLSPPSCYCCLAGRCAPPRTCCYTVRCAVDLCTLPALRAAPVRFQGSLGLAIGLLWRQRVSWVIAIPLVSLVRLE